MYLHVVCYKNINTKGYPTHKGNHGFKKILWLPFGKHATCGEKGLNKN